jgi:replication factor C subunit 3/5
VQQVADSIIAEQSPQRYFLDQYKAYCRILQVRSMLYELLTHCIPPTTIIKVLSGKRTRINIESRACFTAEIG